MKKHSATAYQSVQDESPTVIASFYAAMSSPTPPSINAMYSTGRHGQRFLTKEGAKFKTAFTHTVAAEISVLPWNQAVDEVYMRRGYVHLVFGYHTKLFNASWKPGGRTKSGAVQSPYAQEDVNNYYKVVEDAVKDATGIDDSAHLKITMHKLEGKAKLIEIYYEVLRRK